MTFKQWHELIPDSDKFHQHPYRFLDYCLTNKDPAQNPTPQARKARPRLCLLSRRIFNNCLHRPPTLNSHIHRILRPILRLRPYQPLVHNRSQHRHLVRLHPRAESYHYPPPSCQHGLALSWHIQIPQQRTKRGKSFRQFFERGVATIGELRYGRCRFDESCAGQESEQRRQRVERRRPDLLPRLA